MPGVYTITSERRAGRPGRSATNRAGISVGPPAPNPMTRRIGLLGYASSACAVGAVSAMTTDNAANRTPTPTLPRPGGGGRRDRVCLFPPPLRGRREDDQRTLRWSVQIGRAHV